MESLFSLHDGCTSDRCIDLGVASPSEPPTSEIGRALGPLLTSAAASSSLAGYPDPLGEISTRRSIQDLYRRVGCSVSTSDILVTAGAHSEIILWVDKVFQNSRIGVQVPRYPAIEAQSGTNSIKHVAYDPEEHTLNLGENCKDIDVLYVCNPHNPTGTIMTEYQLLQIVRWCQDNNVTLFYDNVYATFQSFTPFFSIFQIDGADACTVEINSLSKTANFAGLRLGWTTILPGSPNNRIRRRRLDLAYTEAAGVSKLDQMAGRLAISPALMERQRVNVNGYLRNAHLLRDSCESSGLRVIGGESMPMLWIEVPSGDAISFVKRMHDELEIFVSAGPIFGSEFDTWVRMSAFCSHKQALEAANRIESWHI